MKTDKSDFADIKKHCAQNSRISEQVIDKFLINYAAAKDKLEPKMNRKFELFRHVTKQLPKSSVNMFKSQFIAHHIFRKHGLITKYLNHAAIRDLALEKQEFLRHNAEHPWHFSFAFILKAHGDDFYTMVDAFTNEEYLLYSPSMTGTLEEYEPRLWFNLISYNGACYQTFGPVIGYKSFLPDDIFLFATELNIEVADDEEMLEMLEQDPVPFMMLVAGSNYPVIVHSDGTPVFLCYSNHELQNDPSSALGEFITDEREYVVRFQLEKWMEPPHMAAAYFDRIDNLLQVTASTLEGFDAMKVALIDAGVEIYGHPDMMISPTMIMTIEQILRSDTMLFEYEGMFEDISSPESDEMMEHLNAAMQELLPYLNSGKKPDLDALAKKYNVEKEALEGIYDHMVNRLKDI